MWCRCLHPALSADAVAGATLRPLHLCSACAAELAEVTEQRQQGQQPRAAQPLPPHHASLEGPQAACSPGAATSACAMQVAAERAATVAVSARSGAGLEDLLQLVEDRLAGDMASVQCLVPYAQVRLRTRRSTPALALALKGGGESADFAAPHRTAGPELKCCIAPGRYFVLVQTPTNWGMQAELLGEVRRWGSVQHEDHGPEGTLLEARVPQPLAEKLQPLSVPVMEFRERRQALMPALAGTKPW